MEAVAAKLKCFCNAETALIRPELAGGQAESFAEVGHTHSALTWLDALALIGLQGRKNVLKGPFFSLLQGFMITRSVVFSDA